MSTGWLALGLLAIAYATPSAASFLSHTLEQSGFLRGEGFCIDPTTELATMTPYDFTFYARRPEAEAVIAARRLQNAPVSGQKLSSIYHAPLIMSQKMLDEGLSNYGDPRRLERAVYKLVTGKPITVVALGGSVTAGSGVWHQENSWASRLFHWIQMTFPHQGHVLLNKAVPAVTSAYIAPCVLNMVPENTDLVLMEFTFNDAERSTSFSLDDPTRRGMERLLRKLLRMPTRPAILYLHFCPFPRLNSFWMGAEDHIDVLLKYYGVPSLSMRNALHTLLDAQPALLDQLWWPMPSDRLHPSCVGTKFMADQVIGHLQDLAAYVLKYRSQLPAAPHPEVANEVLRAPIFSNNAAEKPETCLLDDNFKVLAAGGQGWHWVNEGKLANKPKWGYISTQVGSQLILKVPLAGMQFPDNRLLIALGVLMSYEHMGMAKVDCIGGCVCPSREINLLHPYKVSLTYWKPVKVQLWPGSSECILLVTNIPKTKSGQNKIKLTSLMVSAELGFVESWTHCEDCEGETLG